MLRDFLKHPLCRATKIFPPRFFFLLLHTTPSPPSLVKPPSHTLITHSPLIFAFPGDNHAADGSKTRGKTTDQRPRRDERQAANKQDATDSKTGRTDSRTQRKGTWRTGKHMGGEQDATARLARVRTCALSPSKNFFNAFAIPTVQSEASVITC